MWLSSRLLLWVQFWFRILAAVNEELHCPVLHWQTSAICCKLTKWNRGLIQHFFVFVNLSSQILFWIAKGSWILGEFQNIFKPIWFLWSEVLKNSSNRQFQLKRFWSLVKARTERLQTTISWHANDSCKLNLIICLVTLLAAALRHLYFLSSAIL